MGRCFVEIAKRVRAGDIPPDGCFRPFALHGILVFRTSQEGNEPAQKLPEKHCDTERSEGSELRPGLRGVLILPRGTLAERGLRCRNLNMDAWIVFPEIHPLV